MLLYVHLEELLHPVLTTHSSLLTAYYVLLTTYYPLYTLQILLWVELFLPPLTTALEQLQEVLPPGEEPDPDPPPGLPPLKLQVVLPSLLVLLPSPRSQKLLVLHLMDVTLLSSFSHGFDDPLVGDVLDPDMPLVADWPPPPPPPSQTSQPDGEAVDLLSGPTLQAGTTLLTDPPSSSIYSVGSARSGKRRSASK